mmetsp:Transcript_48080/g.54482  ORF Transcript_48080/g.54482 Transcript_48080/m.54482 type:complete len:205 (-) Transcript_48080:767-1381(-)
MHISYRKIHPLSLSTTAMMMMIILTILLLLILIGMQHQSRRRKHQHIIMMTMTMTMTIIVATGVVIVNSSHVMPMHGLIFSFSFVLFQQLYGNVLFLFPFLWHDPSLNMLLFLPVFDRTQFLGLVLLLARQHQSLFDVILLISVIELFAQNLIPFLIQEFVSDMILPFQLIYFLVTLILVLILQSDSQKFATRFLIQISFVPIG